jgi:hypothetical protein
MGNITNDTRQVGNVELAGSLNFASTTAFNLAFNGSTSTVNWTDSFWSTNEQWTVYNVGGSLANFSNLQLTTSNWLDGYGNSFNSLLAGSTFSLLQIGQDVVLKYTAAQAAVPEIDPASCGSALALLIGSFGLIERRARRRSGRSITG